MNQVDFILPTSNGRELECVLEYAPIPAEPKQFAVLCHPHPLYGGTMGNKVITTLLRLYHAMGINVVRFNFRGVGKSTGVHDNGNGELDDLRLVVEHVFMDNKNTSICLAGFSFGAFIAAKYAEKFSEKIQHLTLVAPPIEMNIAPSSRYIFPEHFACNFSITIVQGSADEVVSADEVKKYYEKLKKTHTSGRITFLWLEGAGHFFHRRLLDLKEMLQASYLQ